MIYAFVVGTLYAITDEFHQYFSNGRSASIKDVALDSLGVITGIVIFFIIIKIIKYVSQKEVLNE